MRSRPFAHVLLGSMFVLASACGSGGNDEPLTLRLRDSSVEGGDPAFVTFDVGAAAEGQPVTISPAIVLRRDGGDLNVLIARTPELQAQPPISPAGTAAPPGNLNPDTEYRFQIPDIEPGFHELCVNYTLGGTAGRSCAELALT